MNKKELKKIIKEDKNFYREKNFEKRIFKKLTRHLDIKILKNIIISRKYTYYKKNNNGIINKIKCLFYGFIYNKLVEKTFIEINGTIGRKFKIFHQGVIVNNNAVIGDNVRMHGFNCIGNNGISDKAPKIGNNVDIGVGATLIGDIEIADNIIIGANSLVNKSFTEKGIKIAGVPAKKI